MKTEKHMKWAVYEAPVTTLFKIELEGAFMQASVGVEAELGEKDLDIEVEEYDRFDMDITFE